MAVQYANGKIATNGLILALDSGDRNSYSGSGTSWTDLSGNGNTGTLTNGPTYSSTNGGSIVFDGSNDYIDLGNKTLGVELQDKSACVWIYQTTSPSVFAGIIDKDFDNRLTNPNEKNSLMTERGLAHLIEKDEDDEDLNSTIFEII
jgi:hypothetical protein